MVYFITAIGTDSGKTLVSAIFTEALKADYWKPIQAGFPRDTEVVKSLVENKSSLFFPESYLLQSPMSPHAAAKIDGIEINLDNILIPFSKNNNLIVEGAGGLLVPINDQYVVIDIAEKINAAIILVADVYLGSINHTLLTINELERRNLKIAGIVFNKSSNLETKNIIIQKTGIKCLLEIFPEKEINKNIIKHYAGTLLKNI